MNTISALSKGTYFVPPEDSAVAPMGGARWEPLFFSVDHRAGGDIDNLYPSTVVSLNFSHVENGQVLLWTILSAFQVIPMLITLFLWET